MIYNCRQVNPFPLCDVYLESEMNKLIKFLLSSTSDFVPSCWSVALLTKAQSGFKTGFIFFNLK